MVDSPPCSLLRGNRLPRYGWFMARRGWFGIGSVAGLGRREAREGLVLSGGGSKMGFQIGALRYLYDRELLHPDVIVGTSAGAILTAMLAQSSDLDDQRAAIAELERLWLGMSRQSDMFTERTWFRRFRERGPEVITLLQREEGKDMFGAVRRLPKISLPFTNGFTIDPDDQQQRTDGPTPPEQAPMTPEEETLALATSDPDVVGSEFTATQVMALVSGLGRMRGVGSDLGVILRGAQTTRSMYIPGPILRDLLGTGLFTSQRVAGSGVTTRIAMVALESGELRFMREDGTLVDREDNPIGEDPQDFSRGVLASCSIPTVFQPVRLGQEHYVDGGIRENLPAEMAIGPLGCTTTWVVSSNAPKVRPNDSYASKDMFAIMMRATEIQSDESERDDVAYARSAGAIVIEPELDIHDALTIDPGLVRINMDYGWMRAAEVHQQATVAETALNRSIIQARRRAWELERDFLDPKRPHEEAEVLLLARLKYDLREQVPRQRPELLPEEAEQWWTRWEGHATSPTVNAPWMV